LIRKNLENDKEEILTRKKRYALFVWVITRVCVVCIEVPKLLA
jgi:hypothetical protein